jgi:heme-binding NEAT domain protein
VNRQSPGARRRAAWALAAVTAISLAGLTGCQTDETNAVSAEPSLSFNEAPPSPTATLEFPAAEPTKAAAKSAAPTADPERADAGTAAPAAPAAPAKKPGKPACSPDQNAFVALSKSKIAESTTIITSADRGIKDTAKAVKVASKLKDPVSLARANLQLRQWSQTRADAILSMKAAEKTITKVTKVCKPAAG